MKRKKLPNGAVEKILRFLLEHKTDECIIWPYTVKGYRYPQGPNNTYGHSVVCEWTHGPRPNGHEAAHSCGQSMCVNPRHLRWATPAENTRDKFSHGTILTGERNPASRLTTEQVASMRNDRAEHGTSYATIAREHGVSTMTAYRAITGQSWPEVAA